MNAKKFEGLSENQKAAAAALVDNDLLPKADRRLVDDIADEFNISRITLWRWKARDPVFVEYKQHLTTLRAQDKQTELMRVLFDNLDKSQPSTKMLDLLAKMTPGAMAATKQEVDMTESNASQDDVLKRIAELERMKKEAGDA